MNMVITTENENLLKELTGIIYVIKNTINNKCYVGKTERTFSRRYGWEWYKGANLRNKYLKSSIKKYGHEKFQIEIIENSIEDSDELSRLEEKWASTLNTYYPNGYNFAPCSKGVPDRLPKKYLDRQKNGRLKSFIFKNIKTGEIINCNNLKSFCKDHNLEYSSLLDAIKNIGSICDNTYVHVDCTEEDISNKNILTRYPDLKSPFILYKDNIEYKFNLIKQFALDHNLKITKLTKLLTGKRFYYQGFSLKKDIKFRDPTKLLQKYEYVDLKDKNGNIIHITNIKDFMSNNKCTRFYLLLSGKIKVTKGYTVVKIKLIDSHPIR